MTTVQEKLRQSRLGLGTWAIGGEWTAGGEAAGWGRTDDKVSRDAIAEALRLGIRVFDTAPAYGCGHAERLIGDVVGDREDVTIITKVGLAIDETARNLTGADVAPDSILGGLEASRKRLKRDRIEIALLHINSLGIDDAKPVFDALEKAVSLGWIEAYGWSTDFPDRAMAFAGRSNFIAIEHAMNLFFPATEITLAATGCKLTPFIRSPLAMGLLGGRYKAGHRFDGNDIRSRSTDWMDYFKDGVVTQNHAETLEKLRELMITGGRSMAQGALGWLMTRNKHCIPVPGFRTPEQVADLAGAMLQGPLDAETFAEIEAVIDRPPEGMPRER